MNIFVVRLPTTGDFTSVATCIVGCFVCFEDTILLLIVDVEEPLLLLPPTPPILFDINCFNFDPVVLLLLEATTMKKKTIKHTCDRIQYSVPVGDDVVVAASDDDDVDANSNDEMVDVADDADRVNGAVLLRMFRGDLVDQGSG